MRASELPAKEQSMTEVRETVQAVGEILTGFLKSGPTSPDHAQETKTTLSKLARSIAVSADEATASYERVCREFLDKVIRVKGMPTRIISGDRESQPDIVSSSGKHVAQNFDALLASIKKRFEWCVTNYKSEATAYLDERRTGVSRSIFLRNSRYSSALWRGRHCAPMRLPSTV
jgi:hypothetical protein